MKAFIQLIVYLMLPLGSFAQKETYNWYWGGKAGFNFSTGSPIPLRDGAMSTVAGCATMSDPDTGELLFYSNGYNTWNRFHQLMPASQDYSQDCSTTLTQSALIVPVPGQEKRFYLFSLQFSEQNQNCTGGYPVDNFQCHIYSSVVDMELDAGRGDLVPAAKKQLLQDKATSKMTAVRHANGKDYWLVTHEWNSNAFLVYLVSDKGISAPTLTQIGSVHSYQSASIVGSFNDEIYGYLKASPNGKKIAAAVTSLLPRPFDLFDFDPATGQLSNYVNLGAIRGQYGMSFSPDNTKLYVTSDGPETQIASRKDWILQYDLEAGSPQQVIASRMSIVTDNPTLRNQEGIFMDSDAALQLAPNGKLYSSLGHKGKQFVVNQPNQKGYACKVSFESLGFNGELGSGLPNFMDHYFNNLAPVDPTQEADCRNKALLFPNPTADFIYCQFSEECFTPYRLEIIDLLGRKITEKTITSAGSQPLDVTLLPSGVYVVVVYDLKFDSVLLKHRIVKITALE